MTQAFYSAASECEYLCMCISKKSACVCVSDSDSDNVVFGL